jgi:hypothetical protein
VKILLLAIVGLLAGTAHAGTVASSSFDGDQAPHAVVANGVEVKSFGDFTLYEHGTWSPPMAAAPSNVGGVAPALRPEMSTADCWSRAVAPRHGLALTTVANRLAYWSLVRGAECRHSLPVGLLDAVVLQESRYRPVAVSPAGAGGLTQLMPRTAIDLGVVDRFDPASNIEGGARYLRSMLDHYRSVPLALAAYNAGRGAVDRSGGIPPNRETPGYVRKVLGYFNESPAAPGFVLPTQVSHAVSLAFSSAGD